MLIRLQGIVLKTYAQGEDDRLLVLFTKQMGLIKTMAPHAERQRHPLFAPTQVLVKSDFVIQRHGSGLGVIRQAALLDGYTDLRSEVETLSYALAMLELIMRVAEGSRATEECIGQEVEVYEELLGSLLRLRQNDSASMTLSYLQIRMLAPLGISLSYTRCAICQIEFDPPVGHFSFVSGGFVCNSCAARQQQRGISMIHPKVHMLMQKMSRTAIISVGEIRIKEDLQRQIRHITSLFLKEYAGISVRSLDVIDQIQ